MGVSLRQLSRSACGSSDAGASAFAAVQASGAGIMRYGMLAMSTYNYIGLGLITAGIYFGLSYPASLFANWVERKLQYDRR